jgi:5'-phosphate synthase pdxT subunit
MVTAPTVVGVFALQGDYERHAAAWRRAGAQVREVRTRADFEGLDALSMPGGESTTMLRLLGVLGLRKELEQAVDTLPVFATCAGAILLGKGGEHLPAPPLGVLDVDVARNAYGRQVDSFEADIDVRGIDHRVRGVFIRAPWIERIGDGVDVLAEFEDRPVVLEQGNLLATSFHPELVGETGLHEYLLRKV